MKKLSLILISFFTIFIGSFFATTHIHAQWDKGLESAEDASNLPSNEDAVSVLTKITKFLLTLVIFLAVLMFTIAGVTYITAGGDPKRAETATNIVKYTIIGIVVALLGLAVVTTIDNILN